MKNGTGRSGTIGRAVAGALIVLLLSYTYYCQYHSKISSLDSFLISLLLVAVLCIVLLCRKGPLFPRRMIESRRQAWLFIGVIMLGVFARTAYLGAFPPADGQYGEEARTAAHAFHNSFSPFFPLNILQSQLALRLFGNTIPGLRAPFVILGILSVPIFFVAARLLFRNFGAALAAAALFACSTFLAAGQRTASHEISGVATECLAIAALFLACARRDIASCALAGWANGLLAAEYLPYKVIPAMALLTLIVVLLRAPARPRLLPRVAAFCLCAVAVLVPIMLSDRGRPLWFVSEGFVRHRSLEAPPSLPVGALIRHWWEKAALASSFLFIRGGGHHQIIPRSMGIIEFRTGVVGCLALACCAARAVRSPAKLFLAGTVVLTVFLGGMLPSNPSLYRLIGAVPPFYLLIGMLIDDTLLAFPSRRRLLSSAWTAVFLLLVWSNLYNLLAVTVFDDSVRRSFCDPDLTLAQTIAAAREEDPAATVYLLSDKRFLGVDNDYDFLYDRARVRVVADPRDIGEPHGVLIAHDGFIAAARALPGLSGCEEWTPPLCPRRRVLRCRF
ncbi:MAG: glycosyltransferase family 39 protein [bacterium]|nr:glycosyltransferase family 39 protein [bacterium]